MKIIIFGLGLIFGSFLGVIIDRLPLKRNISTGRSMCDACQTPLSALDLVPVLSFLKSQGKCRHCGSKLSWRYPLLEVLTGFIYMIAYIKFGLEARFFIAIVLASLLIVIAFIDIDHMIIFDRFHILIFILGLTEYFIYRDALGSRLLAMIIIALPYLILAIITQGIGGGDVKLISSVGFLLKVPNTVLAFFISTIVGAIYAVFVLLQKKKSAKDAIPYGPFLCIGIYIAYLYGTEIIALYVNLFI